MGPVTVPNLGTIVPNLSTTLRRCGMINTSPSWRRFWLPWRWRAYPWAK